MALAYQFVANFAFKATSFADEPIVSV